MFWRNFKYNLLITLRSKELLFWSLVFVMALGTLFYVTFGNAYNNSELLKEIPVAVYIEDKTVNRNFDMFIAEISLDEKDGDKLLDVTRCDNLDDARKLMFDGDVTGVFYSEDGELRLLVKQERIDEGILASVVTNYHQIVTVMSKVSDMDNTLQFETISKLVTGNDKNEEINFTDANMDVFTAYFYNLLAMGCLFACFSSISFVVSTQANLSALGARTAITGKKSVVNLLSGMMANWILLFAVEVVAMIYLMIIGVDLGDKYLGLIIILLVGTLTGVSLGYLIGSIGKKGYDTKIGISVAVTLSLCFLSGLMILDIKPLIQQKAPFINKINPAALISDSFYALNIYDDYSVFTSNMITLVVMSAAFLIIGSIIGRRKRYASI